MTEFNDTIVLFSLFGSLSIGLTLFTLRSIGELCKRISRLEGFIHKHD